MKAVIRILAITEGKLRTDRSPDGIGAMLDAVECWRSLDNDRFRVTRVQINEDEKWFDLVDAIKSGGYEQIWLFGSGSATEPDETRRTLNRELDPRELSALRAFMDAGGGVFATGDHEDVGATLCGKIPRVRHMRSWGAYGVTPSKYGRSRVDTVFASRFNGDADSEKDAVGKPVWVKYIKMEPHPLLLGAPPTPAPCAPRGEEDSGLYRSGVRWLPDHMHEGECRILPEVFDADVRADFADGAQTEIVAWSVKRGFSEVRGNPEDQPSIYGVVCCYNGFPNNIGRVVVDSTFHHWVHENTAAMRDSAIGRDLDCYPVNIAQWLSKTLYESEKRKALVHALGAHDHVVSVRKQKTAGLTEQEYNELLGATAESVWAANGMSVLVLRETLEQIRSEQNAKVSPVGTEAAVVELANAENARTEKVMPAVAEVGEPAADLPKVNNAEDLPPEPVIPYEDQARDALVKTLRRTGRLLDSFLASGIGPANPD